MSAFRESEGFALITMLVLLTLLAGLILTHFSLTCIEMSTTRSSMHSFVGFYAAEAGLNVRAEQVRQTFIGYGLPAGTSPAQTNACTGTNMGSGDFGCTEYQFQGRDVMTWVEETSMSTNPIVVPRGERYSNLHGHEYHYIVYSTALGPKGLPEAVLEMHFKSRVIPLFQFAAFYDKDLEILPDAPTSPLTSEVPSAMFDGPVHSNHDLYVGSNGTLDMLQQVTVAGDLYHGRKDADSCAGTVQVADPDDQLAIPGCGGGRTLVSQSSLSAWNGMIDTEVNPLTTPQVDAVDPTAGRSFWDHADLRIVLDVDGTPAIEVRSADGTKDVPATAQLSAACGGGGTGMTHTLYNQREGGAITMLEVDVQALLNCAHTHNLMGKALNDATDGGLVWYFTVEGADSATANLYGVRVKNGTDVAATVGGAPHPVGLTIATDQALYVKGNFNSANKIPAALVADSFNVLSNNWSDATSSGALTGRVATATTIDAAILAGSDSTGGAEGVAGQDAAGYNGGLENLIRLHEDWTGISLTYLGSLASLSAPRHVDGAWVYGAPYYTNPLRNWTFDDDFQDALLMPPLSPVIVYLRQELFVRQFEL